MRGSSRKKSSRTVLFATSNRGKLTEARAILSPLGILVQSYDGKGVEIQADTTAEVAIRASESAAEKAKRPILVEDAGLYVDSLNGFPGPYSAYAFKTIGIVGMVKLLELAAGGTSSDRAATFVSSLAFCRPGGEPVLFEGRVAGTISRAPKGNNGFGFDPIFVPNGSTKTFAELTLEEKSRISHRAVAMRQFAEWFLSTARRPGMVLKPEKTRR